MKRALGALALACLMTATGCGLNGPARPGLGRDARGMAARGSVGGENGAAWTVFVYMAADNSLSHAAGVDLNEIENGLKSDDVRFVVLCDQEAKGDTRIYEMEPDPARDPKKVVSRIVDDGGAVIPADHEADTGSYETLEKFLRWGTANYPSKRSALVMWNHGMGAFGVPGAGIKAFCSDDDAGNVMSLAELSTVAKQVGDVQRFDLVGMDMCLLGHVETAYQLAPLSDVLVASEKVEPGNGWNYEAIAASLSANPQMAPKELATHIVGSYQAFYKPLLQETTQSAVDLRALETSLVPALNQLSTSLRKGLRDRGYGGIRNALNQAYRMTAVGPSEDAAIDLGLFARLVAGSNVPPYVRQDAEALLAAYQKAVFMNRTTIVSDELYTGLKIYYHPNGYKPAYADGRRQAFGTQAWNQFLVDYHTI